MRLENIIKQCVSIFLLSAALLLGGCASKQANTSGIAKSTDKTTLNEKFRGDYIKALNQLTNKNYTQADAELNRIMTDNPGFAEGWANLALAQLKAGNITQAMQSANNAAQLEPQSAAVHNLLGLINVGNGAYKIAEQHYVRAIELNPKLANAHYNMGLLNDIFYQNSAIAIQHYERYLVLLNNTDPDTEAWIAELKRKLN